MKTKPILAAGMLVAAVASGFGQPVIITQPQWQTNDAGTTAIFSVEATGAPPLSYQWRFNGVDRAGATDATLLLSNVQPANQGPYSVVVTNVEGAVTSSVARLYVIVPPCITTQPSNQTVDAGGTAVFAVVATGTAPLRYQWRLNGVNLQTKTNTTLSLINVGYTNAGGYTVVVTNVGGVATSQVATLTVLSALHGFSRITALPDRTISLTLTGRVASALLPYFDIYPLEVSSDLVTWKPLTTLVRTNASTNALIYVDTQAAAFSARFYRTFTNQFVTPLAKPSGPYPVGRVNRLVTDPSRTNRYNIATNSSFMLTISYPAQNTVGALPDRYLEPSLANTFSEPATVGQMFAFSILNAPIRTNEASYPVVVGSHGYGYQANRRQHTEKAEELASHGYIVAAMDHIDCSGSVFPDGRLVLGIYSGYTEEEAARALPDRVKDVRFVLDELTRLNRDDPFFVGRLDLARVGGMGSSAGVGTMAEAARVDQRIKAGVFFDGFLQGAVELRNVGLQKPLLVMHQANASNSTLFDKALADAYRCQVRDTVHVTFIDLWRLELANATSRRATEAIRACTLSFFNKYLKGEDNHLLDDPTNSFPVIFNYLKK